MGWPHPDFLTKVLTPEQLEEWARFYDQEPWGFTIEEVRFTKLLAALGIKDLELARHTPASLPVVPPDVAALQKLFGRQARHVVEETGGPPPVRE